MNLLDKWRSKPNKLKGLMHAHERREWIREIENTRGYRLIITAVDVEMQWCSENIRALIRNRKDEDARLMETYLTALEFMKSTILQWNVDGEHAHKELFGRLEALDKMEFDQAQPNTNNPAV